MLLQRINVKLLLLAFAVGLLVCYVMAPTPEVVVKFPSPYNAGNVTYRDKVGTCFKYRAEKNECPLDKNLVRDQPIMEDFTRM